MWVGVYSYGWMDGCGWMWMCGGVGRGVSGSICVVAGGVQCRGLV